MLFWAGTVAGSELQEPHLNVVKGFRLYGELVELQFLFVTC
jgi:hypothetical protein